MSAGCRKRGGCSVPTKRLPIVGLVVLVFGCTGLAARKRLNVRLAGVISVKESDSIRLEDIDPKGRALVLNRGNGGIRAENPELLLWDPARRAFTQRITPDWGHAAWAEWVPGVDRDPRSIKAIDQEGDMLGAFGYNLTFIGPQKTLRKILCAPDLKDPSSPYTDQRAQRTLPWGYMHGAVIARYQYGGLVAAAFNFGKRPRVFLLRPPWKAPYASWRMDRFVKALAWSPDGKTLAVLYSNVYDNDFKFIMPWRGGQPWPTLPDVDLIDIKTGKTRLKFFSGDMETSIVFSPEGKSIYCAGYDGPTTMRRYVIRQFSASNGKLLREFKKPGLRLKGNLAVSPDGRYLVADANSTRWSLGLIFNDVYGYDRRFRFVILDTATGKVVFKHQQKVGDTTLTLLPTFAFSPDGKYLYVDPHLHELGSPEIQVYSLTESH